MDEESLRNAHHPLIPAAAEEEGNVIPTQQDKDSAELAALKKKQSGLLLNVCSFILATETCERVSYYSIGGSLVLLFQNRLHYSNAAADNQYATWSGLCYCFPLLGGHIADSYLGRFRTIAIFSCIYLVGLIVLIVGVLPRDVTQSAASSGSNTALTTEALVFTGIYLLAFGDGGIKPNVSTFGADQFDPRLEEGRKGMDRWFNLFYAAINCGALISFTLIVSITQYGIPWLGGREYGFAVGFGIAALFTFAGICTFIGGRGRYKMLPPTGSILGKAVRIIGQGLRRKVGRMPCFVRGEREQEGAADNGGNGAPLVDPVVAVGIVSESNFNGNSSSTSTGTTSTSTPMWLDLAKQSQGGSFAEKDVDDIKAVFRLLPFLFFLIPYWSVYTQMSTSLQNQSCQMDLSLSSTTKIAVSTLNLFDTLVIICLVPIVDRFVYPFFKRIGRPLTQLQRFGIGFVFSILSMVAAGLLEVYRKGQAPTEFPYPLDDGSDSSSSSGITVEYLQQHISACKILDDYSPYKYQSWYATSGGPSSSSSSSSASSGLPPPAACFQTGSAFPNGTLPLSSITCDPVPLIAPVSVFWQVPIFLLIGISEVFTSVSTYQFFYEQAPINMRSFAASLNLLTTALGTWACIPLVALVNSDPNRQWVPANVNEGYLANFFFLLAVVMVVTTGGFYFKARSYEYKIVVEEEEEEDDVGEKEGENDE